MIQAKALAELDGVQHRFFTRRGGVSGGLYSSLNCGYGSGDQPDNVREKIVTGKLDSWLATIVLLEQEMHNPKFDGKTVQQLRDELTATTGENVVIRRFARFAIGQ